jgi:uncharacterized protein YcbX
MIERIGTIRAIYRYPVKSMAGEQLTSAVLGWHGIEGDRRFALKQVGDTSGFPWLTAGKLPELILYRPYSAATANDPAVPTHVITPQGDTLELRGEALMRRISAAHKAEVTLFQLKHGIFDEAMLSLINTATIGEIGREAGCELDPRRFRPNILVDTESPAPFQEEDWVGKIIAFGETAGGAMMNVTQSDVRCSMIGLDPDTATPNPQILKTVVRSHRNCAGVYGSTLRTGTISVGDAVGLVEL